MNTVKFSKHHCSKLKMSISKVAQFVLLVYLLTISLARYVKSENDADDCPGEKEIAPCTCDREGLSCFSNIGEKDLERILGAKSPYNAYRSVWLMENDYLERLRKNSFRNNRIQNIIIQKNSLQEIEEGAFEGAYKNILKLDLWSNRLTSIPAGMIIFCA